VHRFVLRHASFVSFLLFFVLYHLIPLAVTELLNLTLYVLLQLVLHSFPLFCQPKPPMLTFFSHCRYDLLKRTKLTGVSLNLVKKFAFQMLLTLEFLLDPNVNVVHCDLKPENVSGIHLDSSS
jgi:serine/threonine protein kinase